MGFESHMVMVVIGLYEGLIITFCNAEFSDLSLSISHDTLGSPSPMTVVLLSCNGGAVTVGVVTAGVAGACGVSGAIVVSLSELGVCTLLLVAFSFSSLFFSFSLIYCSWFAWAF